ncbi:peptidyl-dipeptidase Dcp Metallo peptidase. MEROPS family M03A [Saccharicrinis carchari]|uniref:Peptidyl-dipeptidase Dcp Metallo peptidase. MEROPS family M03A n=1 Tax=Saccharicrinis carchari TaxID=1168039 RepID=A0A521BVF3_SACCC|nr:M3 family metallopeptidase [Saccharicrinis carchari]SMO51163.1 peptidyl-dipeptidase Dcp Metallo peptidase. MEROPS family M03A [Saccharicrinis carchari]
MHKQTILLLFALLLGMSACKTDNEMNTNPFFSEYETPFGIAPFNKIKSVHYLPAFEAGIKEQQENIKKIVENSEEPTFENTVEALEYSRPLLTKVSNVFYNLTGANTNDELKEIAKEIAPMLSKQNDDIYLNEDLFGRIKVLYDKKNELELTAEQAMLLEKKYEAFVRGGANLPAESKDEFRKINEELALLTLKFGDNVLNETNDYVMIVDKEADLAGLTKGQIDAAAKTAQEKGYKDKWAFTTQRPSITPFLQNSSNRALREKLFKAYINRGDNGNEYDNNDNIKKIVSLRLKRAQLLGYDNHAAFILEKNMAKTPETVNEKLAFLMEKSLKVAQQELADMQKIIDAEGGGFKLEPWDWWYYSEKVKKQKFDLDESDIRPYFELKNVVDGILYTANQLYGLQFEKRDDLPIPHPDAISFEVKEADGTHVGVLFMDFHPRASKRGGAWMNSYRKQQVINGRAVTPIITMVCNFTSATKDTPALLSFDEVSTLFHEFGHALHGLLSNCQYASLSGTAVPRDFVELPSQIMEHWAARPELLRVYGKHYQTGEVIPDELIVKIQNSAKFNQGFITTEYLAAAILDMDYHTLTQALQTNPNTFEQESFTRMNLIPEIVSRYRSTYFNHIFSGGYSAGYYAYIWSAILDSDAFQAFRENGIFDQETATKFRKNILERGGTEDPMILYKKFRGAEPDEKALLKDRGLI